MKSKSTRRRGAATARTGKDRDKGEAAAERRGAGAGAGEGRAAGPAASPDGGAEAKRRLAIAERERAALSEEAARLRDVARLAERVRAEVAEANERLSLLASVARDLNALHEERILETLATRVPYLFGARCASIYAVDPATGQLVLRRHTHGRPIDATVPLGPESGALMARVVAEGRARVLTGLGRNERYSTPSCIVAPLRIGDEVMGVLNLADRLDGAPFSEDRDLPLCERVADLLANALRNLRLFEQAQREARTDSLTRLPNHQEFYADLGREIVRADRYRGVLSIIMLDIDRFKLINDDHGHLAGDFALVELSRVLRANVRAADVPARYGGDEFAVVLPQTDTKGAAVIAERLRAHVAGHRFLVAGRDLGVRLSLGLAMRKPGEAATELVQAADRALLAAKRAGGDRVVARE